MKTPDELQKKILKSPWFLWILILLGVNPVEMVGPAIDASSSHLTDLSRSL